MPDASPGPEGRSNGRVSSARSMRCNVRTPTKADQSQPADGRDRARRDRLCIEGASRDRRHSVEPAAVVTAPKSPKTRT